MMISWTINIRIFWKQGATPIYPLVICYVAIENDPVEIVDFPWIKMVDLSIVFCNVYQRVILGVIIIFIFP